MAAAGLIRQSSSAAPTSLGSYNLVDDSPSYPSHSRAILKKQFRIPWDRFRCDIFLGAHGTYYDMLTKYDQTQSR